MSTLAVALAACGRLGLGEQTCEDNVREPSPANVLAAQAVPTARYTPCFRSLEVGWDDVDFEAENGRAGIGVEHGTETFLTAVVTASCDVAEARRVMSGHTDIEKFIDIEQIRSDISVAVLPATTRQMAHSFALAERWNNMELGGRRVIFRIDPDLSSSIATRFERALPDHQYIWIIDELDMAENTLEMRSEGMEPMAQLTAEEALDFIKDDMVTETYRGRWYFTFDGGCITYTFDAEGPMAGTVAEDATANLGFYPAYQLRAPARRDDS
ncbi:hypothetical protein ACFLRH_03450 [Actinomycetota bacterium]